MIGGGLCVLLAGCGAYFNTFYTAKKNFNQAEKLYVNPDDRATAQQIQLYDRALQGATKVVVNHPNSKYVDDAVLLMGRSLLGKGDYPAARQKFEELAKNFPESELRDDGLFFHAETYRHERSFREAEAMLDSLQRTFPKSDRLAEAFLRRGQIHIERREFRDAISDLRWAARQGDGLELQSHRGLADAYFALEAYDTARVHYAEVADRAESEELVQEALLRQGDCLEVLRRYDEAIGLYEDRERRARNPNHVDQATIRRAYVHALAGRVEEGIEILERVIEDRQRTPAAAEAQYRIGYIQEVLLDDFDAARASYARVSVINRGSSFAQQSVQRTESLDKIEALRQAVSADTTGREAAALAAFSVAEHYLFEADNPERAVDEYRQVEREYRGTHYAPKAAFAAAWVLERRFENRIAADSAWRHVAATYPENEFGRAASAFLRGRTDSLRASDPLGPTLVQYPLTPGAQPYQRPQGAALRRPTAQPGTVPGRADSALVDTLGGAVIDSVQAAFADSIRRAQADSAARARERTRTVEPVQPAEPDTSRRFDP